MALRGQIWPTCHSLRIPGLDSRAGFIKVGASEINPDCRPISL